MASNQRPQLTIKEECFSDENDCNMAFFSIQNAETGRSCWASKHFVKGLKSGLISRRIARNAAAKAMADLDTIPTWILQALFR